MKKIKKERLIKI